MRLDSKHCDENLTQKKRKTKERWWILAMAAAAVALLYFTLSKATFLNTDRAQ